MAQATFKKEVLRFKNLKFKETIPDRLMCIICKSILKNAKQTECGCKGCESCFEDYLEKGGKACPSNQGDCGVVLQMNSINADNATNKEILTLMAYCPFEGCPLCLTVKELNTHFSECRYRLVRCEKCREEYQYLHASNHVTEHCSQRIVSCQYCKENMKYDDLKSTHLDVDSTELCPEYFTLCPNNCDVKEKVKLKEHMRNCENQKVQCPYHGLNCDAGKMTKKVLLQHLDIEGNKHFEVLVNRVNEIKKELGKYKEQHQNVSEKLEEIYEINKKQTIEFLKVETEFNVIKSNPAPVAATMMATEIAVVYRSGSYIWKVTEFSSKKSDAESGGRLSSTSDPFYTSEYGYKMCLKIYPAGDGTGRNTHLSVYFAIMKSEYDDLLSWPFRQKVTISLLDQDGNGKHHSDHFKPDARSACYQKPEDEYNIASGSPKFILFSTLLSCDTAYRRNDTIYIKITVDDSKG